MFNKKTYKNGNKKNDYLEEFELQNSEMENIQGGTMGYSGGIMYGSCWCAGDRGSIESQTPRTYYGCERVDNGRPAGFGECTDSPN